MNKTKERLKLFKEIESLWEQMMYAKGVTKDSREDFGYMKRRLKKFWLDLFGFEDLTQMTLDDLNNFKSLLEAEVEGQTKKRAIPGLIK